MTNWLAANTLGVWLLGRPLMRLVSTKTTYIVEERAFEETKKRELELSYGEEKS